MKKIIFLMIVTFLVILPASSLLAGPSRPGVNGADAGSGAPIDGGISLLLAAGVGYGAKKIHEARKKELRKKNDVQS